MVVIQVRQQPHFWFRSHYQLLKQRLKQRRRFIAGPFAAGFFQDHNQEPYLGTNRQSNGQAGARQRYENFSSNSVCIEISDPEDIHKMEDKSEQTDNTSEIEAALRDIKVEIVEEHDANDTNVVDICSHRFQIEIENYCKTVEDDEIYNFEPDFLAKKDDEEEPHESHTADITYKAKDDQSSAQENSEAKIVNKANDLFARPKITCALCKSHENTEKTMQDILRQCQSAPVIKNIPLETEPPTDKSENINEIGNEEGDSAKTVVQDKISKPLGIKVRPLNPLKKTPSPRSAFLYWKFIEKNCHMQGDNDDIGQDIDKIKSQDKPFKKFNFSNNCNTNNCRSGISCPDSLKDLAIQSWRNKYALEEFDHDNLESDDQKVSREQYPAEKISESSSDFQIITLSEDTQHSNGAVDNDIVEFQYEHVNDLEKVDAAFADVLKQLDEIDQKMGYDKVKSVPKSLSALSLESASVDRGNALLQKQMSSYTSASTKINDTQVTYM